MLGLAIHKHVNPHQRIWQAVLESAIAEWVRGSARHKQRAERFLFQDENDFPFVCRSAGLNPESVRERLLLRASYVLVERERGITTRLRRVVTMRRALFAAFRNPLILSSRKPFNL